MSIFANIDSILDDAELQTGSISNSVHVEPFATGLLTLDLMTFGNIAGGVFATTFGKEQSGKSTLANEIIAKRVAQQLNEIYETGYEPQHKPAHMIYDYEGSFDFSPNGLFMNTLRKMVPDASYDDVFGIRNPKGKGWEVEPLLRFHKLSEMEVFFDTLHYMAKKLPDVTYLNGKTYLVYDPRENKAFEIYKKYADTNLLKATKKYWCELDAGLRIPYQGLLVADSYPAMLPKSADDDEANKQMALQAREFAKHIPRVRGAFRSKRFTTFGVNQIREKPGFNLGNPEYESCGNTLRFASDLRLRTSAVSPKTMGEAAVSPGSSIFVEDSVLFPGLKDQYSGIKLVTAKNKLGGLDKISVTLRLWRSDGKSMGCGYDPVQDTFTAMKMLGMIAPKCTVNTLKFVNAYGLELATKKMSWQQFKVLALYPLTSFDDIGRVFDEIGVPSQIDPFDIREKISQGILYGNLVERFKNNMTGYVTEEETEVASAGDDEITAADFDDKE